MNASLTEKQLFSYREALLEALDDVEAYKVAILDHEDLADRATEQLAMFHESLEMASLDHSMYRFLSSEIVGGMQGHARAVARAKCASVHLAGIESLLQEA